MLTVLHESLSQDFNRFILALFKVGMHFMIPLDDSFNASETPLTVTTGASQEGMGYAETSDTQAYYRDFLPELPSSVLTQQVGWHFLAWLLVSDEEACGDEDASLDESDTDLDALELALATHADNPPAQDAFVIQLLRQTNICFKASSVSKLQTESLPHTVSDTPQDFYTLHVIRQVANRRAKGVGCVKNWASARRRIAYDMCRMYQEAFETIE